MDEQKLRMLSFIETIISNEKHCMERGKHILMQQIFMNEFNDVIKQNEQKITITRERYSLSPEIYELDIQIPESDSVPLNLIKSDELFESVEHTSEALAQPARLRDKEIVHMKGGSGEKEIEVDVESDSLMEYLNNEMNGGKPKSILKKKVQINAEDNENNKPIETKKDKLKRKLNTMWAEQVKNLGKDLGIKPGKNKKALSKADTIKKILANTKLHDKAIKAIKKIEIVKSETGSES